MTCTTCSLYGNICVQCYSTVSIICTDIVKGEMPDAEAHWCPETAQDIPCNSCTRYCHCIRDWHMTCPMQWLCMSQLLYVVFICWDVPCSGSSSEAAPVDASLAWRRNIYADSMWAVTSGTFHMLPLIARHAHKLMSPLSEGVCLPAAVCGACGLSH